MRLTDSKPSDADRLSRHEGVDRKRTFSHPCLRCYARISWGKPWAPRSSAGCPGRLESLGSDSVCGRGMRSHRSPSQQSGFWRPCKGFRGSLVRGDRENTPNKRLRLIGSARATLPHMRAHERSCSHPRFQPEPQPTRRSREIRPRVGKVRRCSPFPSTAR